MNWIDEQIKTRIQLDDERLEEALHGLASVVQKNRRAGGGSATGSRRAMSDILAHYGFEAGEVGADLTDTDRLLEAHFAPHGVMYRRVTLKSGWRRDLYGPILAFDKDGGAVAVLPRGHGHVLYDAKRGEYVKLTRAAADGLDRTAYCFYRPLPGRSLSLRDFFWFLRASFTRADGIALMLLTLVVTLLGAAVPLMNAYVFRTVVPHRNLSLIPVLAVVFLCVILAELLLGSACALSEGRIALSLSMTAENAMVARLLNLPLEFFARYTAGSLTSILMKLRQAFQIIGEFGIRLLLTAAFSVVYVLIIFALAPPLMPLVLLAFALNVLVLGLAIRGKGRAAKKTLAQDARISGLVFALFSGVKKIKLAGAEKRAMTRWARLYREKAEVEFHPPLLATLAAPLVVAVNMGCLIACYRLAVSAGLSTSAFVGFASAFSLISAAFLQLANLLPGVAQLYPSFEMAAPILAAVPENGTKKAEVKAISGRIEVNNLSFRYQEEGPNIVDDLSFTIKPGEYVAIVGETGCGKSTLLKLLLGFETPRTGSIYYDGSDMQKLDIRMLRQRIGIVMQNSRIFSGSIFSNIVMSAPWLTLDDAWAAAETAGIADDIREMPMGMHTVISENGGGISGGQRERIVIARAVARRPKLLLMDEATSALDNITQKRVAEALASLGGTRVVIAHRLSTVKDCDRILVLKDGKIAEEGSYDALIGQGGLFAALVKRQQL